MCNDDSATLLSNLIKFGKNIEQGTT